MAEQQLITIRRQKNKKQTVFLGSGSYDEFKGSATLNQIRRAVTVGNGFEHRRFLWRIRRLARNSHKPVT
ncbi:MAG: hypothetical protein AB7T17_10030 [Geobacter sp.]